MKKLSILFVLFFAISVNAQEENTATLDNELKLNIAYTLAGIPEVSYERILNEESSIGVSLLIPMDDAYDLKFMLTPYYRLFFGKKRAAGFFIEGNAAVFSGDYEGDFNGDFEDGFNSDSSNETGFGLGFAIGGKLISKSNWTGELLLGLGRTLINEDKTSEAYPRLGISIGKRF